jgi:transketolase
LVNCKSAPPDPAGYAGHGLPAASRPSRRIVLGGGDSGGAVLSPLRIDPQNPAWPERDRFILSKGHAAAALYVALARRGYFPLAALEKWGHLDGHLQGHPDRIKTPGVEMSSGFLGHGLSIAVGMALAQRLGGPRYHVYALMSDGCMQSGVAWEGALTAAKYRCSEVPVIMDYNDVQLDGARTTSCRWSR